MKGKKRNKAPFRIEYFAWYEYVICVVVLALMAALPAVIFSEGAFDFLLGSAYTIYYIVYWCVVAALLCMLITYQKYKHFDRPMRQLSQAAHQVARGDFSVRLQPVYRENHFDYINAMFEDFNTMVEELGSIETLKNDFVSNVSHEIKTPLAVIKSYVTMLQNPNLPEETRRQYMDTICSATDKLSTLVTNILKLNKLENQNIAPQPRTYNLGSQLCDCVLSFEELLERKNIALEVDVEERAMITADPGMMEIIWNNLLSNAIKFTPHGGTVSVKQTSDGEEFRIEVRDTGCGMSEETMRRIFDKFYQANTAHSGEGNGLGLALAYRIVQIVGGTMTVTSRIGEGSAFIVKIKAEEVPQNISERRLDKHAK